MSLRATLPCSSQSIGPWLAQSALSWGGLSWRPEYQLQASGKLLGARIYDYYWTLFIILTGNRNMEEGWCLAICFYCSVLNWDCGLVDSGTNILCGCWLFWQNKIQVDCCESSNIVVGNRKRGRVMSCHLIWLLSVKLGLWSCWQWYQPTLWVLTVFTKHEWDPAFCWTSFVSKSGYHLSHLPSITSHQPISPLLSCLLEQAILLFELISQS